MASRAGHGAGLTEAHPQSPLELPPRRPAPAPRPHRRCGHEARPPPVALPMCVRPTRIWSPQPIPAWAQRPTPWIQRGFLTLAASPAQRLAPLRCASPRTGRSPDAADSVDNSHFLTFPERWTRATPRPRTLRQQPRPQITLRLPPTKKGNPPLPSFWRDAPASAPRGLAPLLRGAAE